MSSRVGERSSLAHVLCAAGLALACAEPPPKNVVIVTIDTLRQDHLGAYGAEVRTPALDAFAADSVVFTEAFATAPTTLPSHTSLFTGTYPHRHGVRLNGRHRVPSEATTLAEVVRGAGYDTAAFVGTAVLDGFYGLDQGFDTYGDTFAGEAGAAQVQRRASEVVDAAIAWLDGRRTPFLLWVHVFDPHGPYDPPAPYDAAYYGDRDPRAPGNRSMEGIPLVFYQDLAGVTDVEYPLARYKGEVSYTDRELGRLLDALAPRADDTLVVVTADHGESLGENAYWFDHGETLSDACVRVPLIVRAPWHTDAASVNGPVSHVDVLPTVLDALGLATPPDVEGQSLWPYAESGTAPDRLVYFETYLPTQSGRRPRIGVRSAEWKATRAGRRLRLFHADDRGDANDVVQAQADEAQALRAAIAAYAAESPQAPESIEPSEDQEDMLRALGYAR